MTRQPCSSHSRRGRLRLHSVTFAFVLLHATATLAPAADICTLKDQQFIVKSDRVAEFAALGRSKETRGEALRCCLACLPPKGTKVVAVDMGLFSSTVRVIEKGEDYGCQGDIGNEFLDCTEKSNAVPTDSPPAATSTPGDTLTKAERKAIIDRYVVAMKSIDGLGDYIVAHNQAAEATVDLNAQAADCLKYLQQLSDAVRNLDEVKAPYNTNLDFWVYQDRISMEKVREGFRRCSQRDVENGLLDATAGFAEYKRHASERLSRVNESFDAYAK